MNHSSIWQDIVRTALVGTERQPLTLTSSPNPLNELLSHLNNTDPEGKLLSAVAAISLYQRAGQSPITNNQPLLEPCPPDTNLTCSTRAAQHLKLMLSKEREKLLPEWLAAAATAKQCVPDYCLPELLELGRNSRQLRPAILAVLGKRGRWLAAQNSDWDYVIGEDSEETWKTGSLKARQLLLHHLRTQDPAAARERLVGVWGQEKSDERLAFIETFQTGLSMEDEPFLEASLDDRRKEVRYKAAELLAQLPESRLCQRMVERVRSSLILKQKRNRLHIDFNLPNFSNESIVRDGIDLKQPPRLLGEKDWTLLQMVAATPLSLWYEINQESPTEWLQAAKRSECDRTLFDGWAVAAVRQKNPEWAEVLCSVHDQFNGYLMPQNQLIQGLISVLSPEQRDGFFLKLLQSNRTPFDSKHPAFSLLSHCRYPWSAELTRVVIEGVKRYLTNTENPYDWSLRSALIDFAYSMNLSLIPELSASLPTIVPEGSSLASYWIEAIDEVLALLNFRQEMLGEF